MFGGVTALDTSNNIAPKSKANTKTKAADGEVDVFDIEEEEWTSISLSDASLTPHGIAEKSCVWNNFVRPEPGLQHSPDCSSALFLQLKKN